MTNEKGPPCDHASCRAAWEAADIIIKMADDEASDFRKALDRLIVESRNEGKITRDNPNEHYVAHALAQVCNEIALRFEMARAESLLAGLMPWLEHLTEPGKDN